MTQISYMTTLRRASNTSFLLCGIALLGACGFDDDPLPGDDLDLKDTEQAVYAGWTPYTSEEYPPISCDGSSLMSSVQCTGGFCDNIRAYCNPTPGSRGGSYWTTYFSEENTSSRQCATGSWVTGLSCRGGYCDNVALQCTYMGNITARACYWTGWVSEEGGGYLSFGAGYYAQGAQCSGRYCDNMRYYVCQI